MVQKIWNKILEREDLRQNLSKLREAIKDDSILKYKETFIKSYNKQ